MNRRFFWQVPECIKFRVVFEDAETVLGANDEGEHRLFRKDSDKIVFSEREALEMCLISLVERDWEMLALSGSSAERKIRTAYV